MGGKYLRFYNGNPYIDGNTEEQVTCDNVVVQAVQYAWYGGKSILPKLPTFSSVDRANAFSFASISTS